MPLTEKSIEKCKEAFALMEKGMSREAVCKQLRMGGATLYEYQKMNNALQPRRGPPKKVHSFVDIVPTKPIKSEQVAVIVCSVDTLKNVIAGLI